MSILKIFIALSFVLALFSAVSLLICSFLMSILKTLTLSFQLSKIESEENLIKRISLYSLLSTDGSWRSQAVSCLP